MFLLTATLLVHHWDCIIPGFTGKTVNVIVPNAFPDFLRWMPGSKDILLYDRYKDFADKLIVEADVICCLDFNALKRIDDMADAVAASPARKS